MPTSTNYYYEYLIPENKENNIFKVVLSGQIEAQNDGKAIDKIKEEITKEHPEFRNANYGLMLFTRDGSNTPNRFSKQDWITRICKEYNIDTSEDITIHYNID